MVIHNEKQSIMIYQCSLYHDADNGITINRIYGTRSFVMAKICGVHQWVKHIFILLLYFYSKLNPETSKNT